MTETFSGSAFIATSVDGFIARPDGSLDWLLGADGKPVESDPPYDGDYGYTSFMASIDALVMGRTTYDAVLGFGEWGYGSTPVMVLTHRDIERPADPEAVVSAISGTPSEVADSMVERGYPRVYVDGGLTVQQFLNAGLVRRLVITRVPVLLGEGIALFGPLPGDVHLRHEATEAFPTGIVQSTYSVV